MSTLNATSAIFQEVSGPHEGPGSYLPLDLSGMGGLGESAMTSFEGPNTVLSQGPLVIHLGQRVPFSILLNQARIDFGSDNGDSLRGRLEARAETKGLATVELYAHPSGQQFIWWVEPQQGPIIESEAQRILRDAVREELPLGQGNVTVFLSTSPVGAPTTWLRTPALPWGAPSGFSLPSGLGDIFTDIARGATSVSADMLCSPAFQAAAAQDIARRYGEEHARTFCEVFRTATAFCSPSALRRAQAAQAEEETRNAWLIGAGVAVMAGAVLAAWYFGGKKSNRGRAGRRYRRVGR